MAAKNQKMFLKTNNSEMYKSVMSVDSINKQVSHGTSPRQMLRALDTYVNVTGPADYDIPQLIGKKNILSEIKN